MRANMKILRDKKGLTHENIAKLIGISRATYTNIELGKKNPSLSVAFKIKKILEYEGDDIFLNDMCLNGTNDCKKEKTA